MLDIEKERRVKERKSNEAWRSSISMHGVRQEFRRSQLKDRKIPAEWPTRNYIPLYRPSATPSSILAADMEQPWPWIKGSLFWKSCHQRPTGQRLAVPLRNTLFAVALLAQRFDRTPTVPGTWATMRGLVEASG